MKKKQYPEKDKIYLETDWDSNPLHYKNHSFSSHHPNHSTIEQSKEQQYN
jgi:hypothetical protein